MTTAEDYINSGILEQYVLGYTSNAETAEIALMAAAHPAVNKEIAVIEKSLEAYAMAQAVKPNPIIKPFLLASIDYMERIKNGELFTVPPVLHEGVAIEAYALWLNRSDMMAPDDEAIFAKIIGYNPEVTTAIVWIKEYAPPEVHDHEYEKFLVVEGTCNIIVEGKVHALIPGDYFAIPLHKKHFVKVTSIIPCKVILQRIAA
jgi:quercetin dioxygenase-like cupin family protein